VKKKTKNNPEHIETDNTDSENEQSELGIKIELDKTGRLVKKMKFWIIFIMLKNLII